MVFSMFTEPGTHNHTLILEYFHHSKNKPCNPLVPPLILHLYFFQSLATTKFAFWTINLDNHKNEIK